MNFIFSLLGTILFWFLVGLASWSVVGFVASVLIYRDWNRKFYTRLSAVGENLVYLAGGPLVWACLGLDRVIKNLKGNWPVLRISQKIFKA